MKMIFLVPAIVTLVLCSSSTRAQLDNATRKIEPGTAKEAHKSLAETEAWRLFTAGVSRILLAP